MIKETQMSGVFLQRRRMKKRTKGVAARIIGKRVITHILIQRHPDWKILSWGYDNFLLLINAHIAINIQARLMPTEGRALWIRELNPTPTAPNKFKNW